MFEDQDPRELDPELVAMAHAARRFVQAFEQAGFDEETAVGVLMLYLEKQFNLEADMVMYEYEKPKKHGWLRGSK